MVGFQLPAGISLLSLAARSAVAVPIVSEPTTTFEPPGVTAPPVRPHSNVTYHGPYTGPPPTTTGALTTDVLAPSIPALPPGPNAFKYPSDGKLHAPLPAPYTPSGGDGTNGSEPVYRMLSDWDYQSIALTLYVEWFELDLFHWGLATFSDEDFEKAGLTAEDRFLIQFMAEQEVGHATLMSNMLGPSAPMQCEYNYPVSNVREWLDFCQKVARYGEAGVYGFLNHLDAHDVGQMLLQSITVEARQALIFRQFDGLFPTPEWFTVGIPQSWAWSLLAPYISSCPANQTRLVWQNFPSLYILNQPNPARIHGSHAWNETTGGYTNTLNTTDIAPEDACANRTLEAGVNCLPGIARNRSEPLSYPGRQVFLEWDDPGRPVGPNNSYVTDTQAGEPAFAAWVSQLNVTYTPLQDVRGNSAWTVQPGAETFAGDPQVNGTIFLLVTDTDLFVTPYNLTMLNPHVRAVAMYQAG